MRTEELIQELREQQRACIVDMHFGAIIDKLQAYEKLVSHLTMCWEMLAGTDG